MSENIRVSYLTTNYNKNDVIKESIESLLADLPTDGELIVVDGGSTDGSIDTLRELESANDRLHVHVEKSNLGEGRQRAVNISNGDILVQHLDTDRRYEPHVSTLVDIFESTEKEQNISDLVLMTFDSIYIMRSDTMDTIGSWPPIARVEERIFVDRIENNASPRILPIQISEELPSADRDTLKGRLSTWRDTSRDLARAGFSLQQLIKWNHNEFPLWKAIAADFVSIYGVLLSILSETYTTKRESWRLITSWQSRYVATESGRERYTEIKLAVPNSLDIYTTDIEKKYSNKK